MVAQAQKILFEKGMYDHADHPQSDGIFGRETRDALYHFQKNFSLPQTGMFDDATLRALGIETISYGAATAAGQGAVGRVATPAGVTSPYGDVLTPAEVAAILKVSDVSVISLLESGELPGKKNRFGMADLSHGGGRAPQEVRVKPETAHEALFSILPALVEPVLHGRWLRNARSGAGSQVLRP